MIRSGQTRFISVSLLTTTPDASISTIRTSNARSPSSTARPSARSSRRCGRTRKRANSIAVGVGGLGSILAAPSFEQNFGSSQIVEQFLCRFEIGGREAFGKPVVDRLEERSRIGGTAPIVQQPGEARGGTQLPGERALPTCPVERLPKVILRCRGSGRALQQQKLALDAQQLGKYPAFFGALRTDDRLLDHGKPLGDLPGP